MPRELTPAREAAEDSIAHLLDSKRYSDLTLKCMGQTFPVHRAIVCGRSPVLQAECDGPFVESNGVIAVAAPTASVGSIKRLISYLYTHEYSDEETVTTSQQPSLTNDEQSSDDQDEAESTYATDSQSSTRPATPAHAQDPSARASELLSETQFQILNNVHTYCLADYYLIPDLKRAAIDKFGFALLKLNDSYVDSRLKNETIMGVVAEIVTEVYKNTGAEDELRARLICHLAFHRQHFAQNKTFLSRTAHISDYMSDLMIEMASSYEAEISEHADKWASKKDELELDNLTLQMKIIDKNTEISQLNRIKENFQSSASNLVMGFAGLDATCRHCHCMGTAKPERKGLETWRARCSNCSTWF